MPFTKTEQSTTLPVSVDLLKKQSNVTFDVDDALIEFYLKAVVAYGEKITGRTFVQSTFELDIESFPTGKVALLPNLQSVDSVAYVDADGDAITLSASDYKVKKTALIGYVEPVDSWPYDAEDIVITFKAGYPVVDDSPTTPNDLVMWLMVKVADYYAFRESYIVSSASRADALEMPQSFCDNMLSHYIVPGIGSGA